MLKKPKTYWRLPVATLLVATCIFQTLVISRFLNGTNRLVNQVETDWDKTQLNSLLIKSLARWNQYENLFSTSCRNRNDLKLSWDEFLLDFLNRDKLYASFKRPDSETIDLFTGSHSTVQPTFENYFKIWLQNQKTPFNKTVRIIEVGSYAGRSTIEMARTCQKSKVNCSILAVDAWAGSPPHFERLEMRAALKKSGILRLFEVFLTNVNNSNVNQLVTPLRLPSAQAAHVLHCFGLKADFIYIDASHEYEDVKRDIKLYENLLSPGGYLFGHDFLPRWPGVVKAVLEFAVENHFTLLRNPVDPIIWVLKPRQK